MKHSKNILLKLIIKTITITNMACRRVDFLSLVKHIGNLGIGFHDGLRNKVNYIANSRRILKFVDNKKIK